MSPTIEQIYRQYLRLVRSQVQRILRDDVDTDDIVQTVFIKYWRTYGQTAQEDPAALLFCMATRAGICALRARRRRAGRETVFAEAHPATAKQASQLEVQSILAVVSQPDGEAAALYYLADMSQREVAETLETTRHDVTSRLERFGTSLAREAKKHAWQVETPNAK